VSKTKLSEAAGIDYAVYVLNEMIVEANPELGKLSPIWNTSLGLAHLKVAKIDEYGYPILSETIGYESVSNKKADLGADQPKDIFAAIRHEVYQSMHTPFGFTGASLVKHPDLLLDWLTEIVSSVCSKELEVPIYKSVSNFSTLNGSISLPFVSLSQLQLTGVISLTSES
jgi:hypothetical protein